MPSDSRKPGNDSGSDDSDPYGGEDRKANSELQWAGVGFELAGTIALLTLAGYGIDAWLGTGPWGMLVGGVLGIVGGLYNLLKRAIQANRTKR